VVAGADPESSIPRGVKIAVFLVVILGIALVFYLRSIPKAVRPTPAHFKTTVITQTVPG
jgi:hypothetical protein